MSRGRGRGYYCTRVILTFVGGCGGVAVPLAGTTNSVMLCAGSVATMLLPLSERSARRVMVLAEVSCQTCAVPPVREVRQLDRRRRRPREMSC